MYKRQPVDDPAETPTDDPVEEPTEGTTESPTEGTPKKPVTFGLPRAGEPKTFKIEMNFKDGNGALIKDEDIKQASVEYYEGGAQTVPVGSEDITISGGTATVSNLTPGRIYMLAPEVYSNKYMPDMGGSIMYSEAFGAIWAYVNEDGLELINGDNFNRLMDDTQFKDRCV